MDEKQLCALLADVYERLLSTSQSLVRLRSDADAFYRATKEADPPLYESFQKELKRVSDQETRILAALHDELWPIIEKLKRGEL